MKHLLIETFHRVAYGLPMKPIRGHKNSRDTMQKKAASVHLGECQDYVTSKLLNEMPEIGGAFLSQVIMLCEH
jgi:hypothetical protein